ncbi:MAG: cytidylate kinase family protein [Candidatus Aenigmatarchaeota archaeon]
MTSKKRKKKVVITVSGLSGSGKTYVAKFIAKKLKLRHKSAGEIFRKVAKSESKSLEEFCKTRSKDIDLITDRETEKLLKKGNIIIDGRLSGYVATKLLNEGKLKNCFRIFVDCPLKIRAQRVAKRDGLSIREAIKKIIERDESDLEKYKKIYKINPCNKRFYDVIIDNSISENRLKEILENISKVIKDFRENRV